MDVTTQIAELLEKFDQSKSVYMELKAEEFSLKLKKQEACLATQVTTGGQPIMPAFTASAMPIAEGAVNSTGDAANNVAQTSDADYIKAPLVGVFYAAPSPDKEPFVQVGKHVKKGETVCLIEAMKMMSEVTASKDGTITEVLVQNGELIEFDQPLFAIQE